MSKRGQARAGGWSQPELRRLLGDTVEAYLAPAYDPKRDDVSAATIARAQGRLLPPMSALLRVERFALTSAAIYRTTQRWTTGHGRDARIQPGWLRGAAPDNNIDDPFKRLSHTLRNSYLRAALATEKDRRTHVAHFLGRYAELGLEGMAAAENFIRIGGSMPLELESYTRVSARALSESEQTRRFPAARRIAVAHQLSTIVTRRASLHVVKFVGAGGWERIGQMHPLVSEVQPAHPPAEDTLRPDTEAIYELLGPDGAELMPIALRIWEDAAIPLLKCPAHQRVWGAESALQTQTHASINLAGSRGLYSPRLIVPPLYPQT
ncbi:MAG TPA: hypothetical protein VLF71_02140 [Candidatus Saccharimonadales bacterium]|nr:hypothetical protein [Candidatus Saccharimonadales bacterium]